MSAPPHAAIVTVPSPPTDLISDQPLEHSRDDRLGRTAFAARLARLVETAPPEGLVIGLAAPWGEGKTSVLNFAKESLATAVEARRVQVVDFNPWYWSGTGELVS